MDQPEITQMAFLPVSVKDIEAFIHNGGASLATEVDAKTSVLTSGKYGKGTFVDCNMCDMGPSCGGHFAYLHLLHPIPNPVFISNITKILEMFCIQCNFLDIPGEKKKCRCTTSMRKVTFENGEFVWRLQTGERLAQTKTVSVPTTQVLSILETHFDVDNIRKITGFSNIAGHRVCAVDCFMQYIPICPNSLRPDGESGAGSRVTNFVTLVYKCIVEYAQELNNICKYQDPAITTTDPGVAKYVMQIYNAMRLLFMRIPKSDYDATCKSFGFGASVVIPHHQDFEGFLPRLSGKKGLFREHALAKRVEACARSVISPTLCLRIDEVGIPRAFRDRLIVNETINERVYRFRIRERSHVLLGRNPTLSKTSIMALRVVFVDSATIQINTALTPAYNADFDGDEMNVFSISEPRARAECAVIMAPSANILSPQTGSAVIHPVQECITGAFVALRDNAWVSLYTAMHMFAVSHNIAYRVSGWRGFVERLPHSYFKCRHQIQTEDIASPVYGHGASHKPYNPIVQVSARAIISCVFPPLYSYKKIVRDGVLSKDALLTADIIKAIVTHMYLVESSEVCAEFIYAFQRNIDILNRVLGISVSYADCVPPLGVSSVDALAYYNKEKEKTNNQSVLMSNIVSLAHRAADDAIIDSGTHNGVLDIIESGAKGKKTHFFQMAVMVGQQNVRGAPPRRTISDGHILPHVRQDKMPLLDVGFVHKPFSTGLSPLEFFIHAMSAREGIVSSSTSIRTIGFLSRNLNKFTENAVAVDNQGTVKRYGIVVASHKKSSNLDYHYSRLFDILRDNEQCEDFVHRLITEAADTTMISNRDSTHYNVIRQHRRRG